MQRNLRPALLAVLCVLAIALGAATLQTAVSPEGGGGGPQFDGATGGGDNRTQNSTSPPASDLSGVGEQLIDWPCIPFLLSDTFAFLVALTVLIAGGFLYWRGGAFFAAALLTVAAVPFTLVYLLLTDCGSSGSPRMPQIGSIPNVTQNGSLAPGPSGSGSAPTIAPMEVVIFVLLLVVVGAAFLRATGDDTESGAAAEPDEESEEEAPSLSAVGAAAGEAADRIEESESLENEVFRAWREMTDHLDVPNPESSTPAEFAAAAHEAGMAAGDVDTLTDLFREIRYGGEEPTPDREERAVAALRGIEETYAEDEP